MEASTCGSGCGCGVEVRTSVEETPPIACSLGPADQATRIDEWRDVLVRVTARAPVDGGLRLTLAPDAPVAEIARLAVAEQACCQFFSFALTVDGRGTALEVTAPADALPIVHAFFGT